LFICLSIVGVSDVGPEEIASIERFFLGAYLNRSEAAARVSALPCEPRPTGATHRGRFASIASVSQ
jgi:hypothetical protein